MIADENEITNAEQTAPVADVENTEIDDEEVPLAVINESEETEIEEEETPLATANLEEKRHWWWWILLVVGAITGKTGYDKYNNKGIFAKKKTESGEGSDDSSK